MGEGIEGDPLDRELLSTEEQFELTINDLAALVLDTDIKSTTRLIDLPNEVSSRDIELIAEWANARAKARLGDESGRALPRDSVNVTDILGYMAKLYAVQGNKSEAYECAKAMSRDGPYGWVNGAASALTTLFYSPQEKSI